MRAQLKTILGKRKVLIPTIAVATALVLAFLILVSRSNKPAEGAPRPIDVQVVKVEQKDVPVYNEWIGTTEGMVNADIRPQVSGYLLRQDYKEGSFVKKGQLLFEIDPRPFQAALDQAQGQLAQFQGQLEQANSQVKQAEAQVAQANSQLLQAQAQLAQARANQVKTQLDVNKYAPLLEQKAVTQQDYDNAAQSNDVAKAQVKAADAGIETARAQLRAANAQVGTAKATVKAAEGQIENAKAGVRTAELNLSFTRIIVTEGIYEIVVTLVEAMILVAIVVFLFLQNWRATLIPLIAVPVSLIGTFAIFPLLGFSINTLSLFAFVLAIGLVVDDAIIVVEAVEHHIEEGLSPRDATLQAMKEVSGPVVAIAVILASIFLPVAFIGGVQGRLNNQFAVTIAISMLISAFNALTLSPALAALLLRPRKESRGILGRFFGGFNRAFEKVMQYYLGWSRGLIRKAIIAVLILIAFMALDGLLGKRLPTSFLPEEDYGYAFLNVQLPAAASLSRTDEVLRKIEKIIARNEGVQYTTTVGGFSLLTRTSASYQGYFFLGLKPWGEPKSKQLQARAIVDSLNGQLMTQVPEAIAFALMPPAIPGLGNAGGFSFWLQDRSGGSVEFLDQNLQKFLAAARKRPELTGVLTQFNATVPQIYADVDRDKVLKQGVAVGDVYQTLQANLGGLYLNQFNRFGRQWRVFLQAEGEERRTADDMNSYYVRNNDGTMVPLSTLLATRTINGPEFTTRFNLYRAAQVLGSAAPGYSSGQAMAALEEVARQTLPPEIGYDWADLSYQEKKSSGSALVRAAKAAYFPRISLTGNLGFQSNQLSNLFTSGVWSFIPQITAPIFTAGRLKSNVKFAKAQQELALVQYQQTIQTAFREVSDALVQYRKVKDIRAQQELLVTTLQDRSRLAHLRYEGGVDSLLNALDADRELFNAELSLAQTKRNESLSLVQLYKALGGGWQQ